MTQPPNNAGRGRISTALTIGAIVTILALISTLLSLNALRVERAQHKISTDTGAP